MAGQVINSIKKLIIARKNENSVDLKLVDLYKLKIVTLDQSYNFCLSPNAFDNTCVAVHENLQQTRIDSTYLFACP